MGDIAGTLADQTHLQAGLDAKADAAALGDAAGKDVGTGSGDVAAGIRGLPSAGTARQVLRKKSATDFDAEWVADPVVKFKAADETRSSSTFTDDGNQPAGADSGGSVVRGEIHVKRREGLRLASIRDFHSFRVTWVTLALTAGVPLELVQRVTAHRATDVVLKHYFQPRREAFRHALQSAMPTLLTNGKVKPQVQIREIVEGMTAKTWKRDRARILALLPAGS